VSTPDLRKQRLRAAIFAFAAIAVLVAVILLLGRSQAVFSRKVALHATFSNTGGLIPGAEVRVAGVAVGIVRAIHFDKELQKKEVQVELAVGAEYMPRIRKDSVAQIASKGLLGDMIVDVTVGNADQPQLKDGDEITSAEASGLAQAVESVRHAIVQVDTLAADVDTHLKALITPQVTSDFGRVLHSAASVAERVEKGPGLLHAALYDKVLERQATGAVAQLSTAATRINTTIGQIEEVMQEARSGKGLIHGLVYDPAGGKAVTDLARLANELASTADEIRTGNGLVHSLIYEQDRTNLLQNLAEVARILKGIAEETAAGKGTIGGLLKDPSAYEDLTTLLGNLKRNELLKALLRATIQTDGLKRPAEPTK
jgi:phospholipid/cholesterol/gamma-HCH transport system substrate-binding protein